MRKDGESRFFCSASRLALAFSGYVLTSYLQKVLTLRNATYSGMYVAMQYFKTKAVLARFSAMPHLFLLTDITSPTK